MKTIEQSVCVDFKAVELEDAMKVAPLMDALNRSLSEKETCTIQMPREIVCNVLKILSDFGFRMSDGSYYKELPKEINPPSPSETGVELVHKGTELVFVVTNNTHSRFEIIKTIKNHLGITLKDSKESLDNKRITLPHDIAKDTFNKLRYALNDLGVHCYVVK